MGINLRIGARFEAECCNLVTSEGQVLIWASDVNKTKFLRPRPRPPELNKGI